MSHAIPCPLCGAETGDGLLCRSCVGWIRTDLRAIGRLWPQLQISVTRQTRIGGGGKRTDKAPLVFDVRASAVASEVRGHVLGWVRMLDMGDATVTEYGCWCEPYRPCKGTRTVPLPDDPAVWCAWLVQRMERIRAHENAAEAYGTFQDCRRAMLRAVDLPPEQVYCGACELCGADLYARARAESVVCRECEKVNPVAAKLAAVNVAERRDGMLARARDLLVTMDELLTAVPSMYGVEIRRNTVNQWVSRGRLAKHGDRFRISDVVELATGVSGRSA